MPKSNSNSICSYCQTKNITYGILDGNFTYFCNTCIKSITKDDVFPIKFFDERNGKRIHIDPSTGAILKHCPTCGRV